MHPRKKVGADLIWHFGELPPAELLKSLRLERAANRQDEFYRAEWFWKRRPKALSRSLVFFFCYLTVIVGLSYDAQETISLLLVWIVAGASCALIDHLRLNRWRNEYESSIKRVLVDLSERK
jgi:hypothetical protein